MHQHRVALINALICVLIASPFGLVSGNLVGWIVIGLFVGGLLGLLADVIFRNLFKNEKLIQHRLLILVLVETVLAIYILAPGYGAYHVVHPTRKEISMTPADLDVAYQDVLLKTSDGVELAGWYVPSKNQAAVILVHALQGNRVNTVHHLQVLSEMGYGVLALDLRAHGESGGDKFAAGWDSDRDVLAAIEFLKSQPEIDPNRIGALGLSVGANIIIYTAAHSHELKAIWADGTGVGRLEDLLNPLPPEFRTLWFMSPVYWMYDRIIEIMSGVPAPPPIKEEVKLVAPCSIQFVSTGQGWEQFQSQKYHANAGEKAFLWELPQDHHISGLFTHPEEYAQKMNLFFGEKLLSE